MQLKLEFGNAARADADYQRIYDSLYSANARGAITGSGQVIERDPETVKAALRAGGAAFLSDAKDPSRVVAATFAYRAGAEHTEFGSTMSRQPGAGAFLVAALMLKERLNNPGRTPIAAIQDSNEKSIALYRDRLHWKKVGEEKASHLYEVTDKEPPVEPKSWYEAGDIAFAVNVVNRMIEFGGFYHHDPRQRVGIDFSALDKAGLTDRKMSELNGGSFSRPEIFAYS